MHMHSMYRYLKFYMFSCHFVYLSSELPFSLPRSKSTTLNQKAKKHLHDLLVMCGNVRNICKMCSLYCLLIW